MRPILLIFFGIGSLLLPAGFALRACGFVRSRNAASAVVRTIADIAAAALAFWAVGAGILFQSHHPWFGFDGRFFFRQPPEFAATEFFHLTICVIGSAITTGALAERSRFFAGVATSAVLGGLVFPAAGHCVWFGQLREWSFIDFGGASVIHLSAAVVAAVGVAVVGSRSGRYGRDGSSNPMAGQSPSMVGIGALLMMAGCFPYLVGCVCAHWTPASSLDEVIIGIAATNTLLAAAGGVAGGVLLGHFHYRKLDPLLICNGLIAGLVAISSGIAAVSGPGAIVIGFVAGVLAPLVAHLLQARARLDDPVGLIAVHGSSAVWGTLATAFFVPTTYFADHFRLLAIQAGGLALVIVCSALVATLLFITLAKFKLLRSKPNDELPGLDAGEHGITATGGG